MLKTKNANSITFTAEVDGKDREMTASKPTAKQSSAASQVYNRAFKDAIVSGAILRMKLEDFMVEQGVWDDKKKAELARMSDQIEAFIKIMKNEDGKTRESTAKKVSLKLRQLRADLVELISQRTAMDVLTAEGQADNEKFNYLVSQCVVYNDTKQRVFLSLDDYLNNNTQTYAAECASKVARLMYDLNEDYEHNLIENVFLRDYGYADKDNRLINSVGHYVDVDGKLIDEQGYYVNDKEERVDSDGKAIVEEEDRKSLPFLDDNDKPIVREKDKKPVVKRKKKDVVAADESDS